MDPGHGQLDETLSERGAAQAEEDKVQRLPKHHEQICNDHLKNEVSLVIVKPWELTHSEVSACIISLAKWTTADGV